MPTEPTIQPRQPVPRGATHAELRRQHIERFRALPPEERLAWSLRAGWALRDSLSPEKAKIQESLRHGGKRSTVRLADILAATPCKKD